MFSLWSPPFTLNDNPNALASPFVQIGIACCPDASMASMVTESPGADTTTCSKRADDRFNTLTCAPAGAGEKYECADSKNPRVSVTGIQLRQMLTVCKPRIRHASNPSEPPWWRTAESQTQWKWKRQAVSKQIDAPDGQDDRQGMALVAWGRNRRDRPVDHLSPPFGALERRALCSCRCTDCSL